jgi:mycothiol system anti-sigma-R factor
VPEPTTTEPSPGDSTHHHGADPCDEPAAGFIDCDESIGRLYSYLDGELTEQRRVEIARHLDLCGPCVSAFGFEAELRRVIANRCKDHVPDALIARVAGAIQAEADLQSN